MRRLILSIVAATAAIAVTVSAADWPQYLGPERNGIYRGPAIADTWPATGPKVVWRKTIGQGFAGPAVAGNRVLIFHRVKNEEVLESLDPATGMSQWRYAYPTTYRDDFGFDAGPRAVPVVANGVVYTYGAEGQLHAVDITNGQGLWHVDAMRKYQVPKNFFGAGGSPIVEGNRVIANIGGPEAGIVAFDAKTGRELWTTTKDGAS